MAGARKRQPQTSGTGEKRNRAAHGAPTEPGLLPERQPSQAAKSERSVEFDVLVNGIVILAFCNFFLDRSDNAPPGAWSIAMSFYELCFTEKFAGLR